MPVCWFVARGIAWVVLFASLGGVVVALVNEGKWAFGLDRFMAIFCGCMALLTAVWFLFFAICRKFEEGVAMLESRFGQTAKTPMCRSWHVLYLVGGILTVLLSIALIGTFIAYLCDDVSGEVPLRLLIHLLLLAFYFLVLFLARRFHDGVCALETAAGNEKPEAEPMPSSWYVCNVILWIVVIAMVAAGVYLVATGLNPDVHTYTDWQTGIKRRSVYHDWDSLWTGVKWLLSATPVAFGLPFLFLVRRFWSAIACLHVPAVLPARERPADESDLK